MNRNYLACFVLFSVLSGCASLPENTGRTESYVFTDTQDTMLGRDARGDLAKGAAKDGFVLLGSGLDAFVARAALAEVAERSIDVQYYLYHNDLVGKLFTGFLWKAAGRGVRVRILVDDMGLDGRDEGIIALDSHPNIELRIFNPFDREIGRGVQFVTGHCKDNEALVLDQTALSDPGQTLVIYMGLAHLPQIVRDLVAAGRPEETPVAIVEHGTTPRQRNIVTTIGELQQAVDRHAIASPAMLIIGPVVALAEELDWFMPWAQEMELKKYA